MGLVVTIVSKDKRIADSVADFLRNNLDSNGIETTILTGVTGNFERPKEDKPAEIEFYHNYELDMTCGYYLTDYHNVETSALASIYDSRINTFLKSEAFKTFLKDIKNTNPEPAQEKEQEEAKEELNTLESAAPSPESKDYSFLMDKMIENQNSKYARYCFTAGLALCATSGILFLFAAPAILTVPAIVIGLLLIGLSYYFDRDIESTADKACENLMACSL